MSKKSAASKKEKPKYVDKQVDVYDIIDKVNASHEKMDKKLAELCEMCSPKELRAK